MKMVEDVTYVTKIDALKYARSMFYTGLVFGVAVSVVIGTVIYHILI